MQPDLRTGRSLAEEEPMANRTLLLMTFVASSCMVQPALAADLDADLEVQTSLQVVDNDFVFASTSSRRSYCCTMNVSADFLNVNFSTTSFFGAGVPLVDRAGESPALSRNTGAASFRRKCWKEPTNFSTASRSLRIAGAGSSPIPISVLCEETTLFGNFNTSVSDFNFLELTAVFQSEASAPLNGTVIFRTANSGTETSVDFTISPSATFPIVRKDISIHDAIGGRIDFGQAIVRHDGAPGQLRARVSQYDITSTSPLNFTLVGQEECSQGAKR